MLDPDSNGFQEPSSRYRLLAIARRFKRERDDLRRVLGEARVQLRAYDAILGGTFPDRPAAPVRPDADR